MKNFHPDNNCPVRNVLCRLGDKWSMLVLITLNANGTMRFCDIHKTIADISQRMLTVTLRTLETDGLVSRKVYAEVPPRVEYELTERGKSLIPVTACCPVPSVTKASTNTTTEILNWNRKSIMPSHWKGAGNGSIARLLISTQNTAAPSASAPPVSIQTV